MMDHKKILVASGGFTGGYAMLGAFKHIFSVIPFSQFTTMAGSSVGGLILFLLIISYTVDKIIKIKMFDIDIVDNLCNFMSGFGMISSRQVKTFFSKIMKRKGIDPGITFRKLYELTGIQFVLT